MKKNDFLGGAAVLAAILALLFAGCGDENELAEYPISISVSRQPTKKTYLLNEVTPDYAGLEVTVYYMEGGTAKVPVNDLTFNGFDSSQVGENVISISYKERSASFPVTIIVDKIEITAEPTKNTYLIGDSPDLTGISVTATGYNNSTKTLGSGDGLQASLDTSSSGVKTSNVSYGGKTATFNVTVNPFTVTFDKNHSDSDETGWAEADPSMKLITTIGGNVGILPDRPTRSGYAFVNWNTETDGSGSVFNAKSSVTRNITVYAQWAGPI